MGIQKPSCYSIHSNKYNNDTNPGHRAKIASYVAELLQPVLPLEKHNPILEIGCGSGAALLALRNMGYSSLKGIDCAPERINIARSLSLDVELTAAIEYLDRIGSNHFSLIYMIDAFEPASDERVFELFCRIFRALSPGGQLFLKVPNADSPIARRCQSIDCMHPYGITAHSISQLLEDAGFREITIKESLPREPRPEDFDDNEEGRKAYRDSNREFLETTLAHRLNRWQSERLLPEAQQMPLTPNINVLAVKRTDDEPVSRKVIIDTDNVNFDPLKFIDQIEENRWKIRAFQEWLGLIETRFTIYNKRQDSLQKDLLNESDLLKKRHRLLENEIALMKERNIFKAFFIDLVKACFSMIRYPFVIARAIRRLPSTYEEVINRQYYGDKNE